jgi:hypothetical protein
MNSRSRQRPATSTTRYKAVKRPRVMDGYPQRIPMWDAVLRLGSANASELLAELRKESYARPRGAAVDERYCQIELTAMTRLGWLRRMD